ncbi:MAG: hypothetical protein PHR61_04190 [Candidatus Absconditabacteria bacterium]|nr:hypothetical protein [Candidatus Absconditabacteria bacterium]
MKRILFFLSLWVIMIQGIYATHIIKAPGSMTDVFTELPIKDIFDADTLFIEGGTGDIYLKAGPVDDGISYSWSIGANIYYTYSATFTYTDATATLPDGSKGSLVSIIRSNPDQSQYFYVVYRNLPLKPTTPSGSTSVCAGTSEGYSSTSTNATSYQWYLDPVAAGTITDGTTSSPTITWSSSWTGDATITVKGIKDANESPLSDPLTVTVTTVPTKPVITGDPFVKKGSSIIYTGSSIGAVNWTWVMTPNDLATATPSGQNVTIDFTSTGTFDLTAQAHNTCGDGIVSDNFNVEIVDISAMQADITQLKADTALYRQQTRDSSAVAQDLRLRLADSTAVINDLRTNNNLLQGQVADLEIDTVLYKSVIRFLENDSIPELHGIITTVTGERDAALTANATLTTQLATVTGERDDALAANATLTTQLATVTGERDDALAANATLTTQLATVTGERDDALADVALLQTQVSNLEQEVADLQAIIDGGMQDLLDQIDQLEADKLVLQGQVDNLTSQVATLTASNSSLQTQVNSLTDQVATLTASNTSLQTQVNSLTDQVATLTASNTSLQTQVDDLTAERDQALGKINEIADLLGVSVEEIESIINELIAAYAIEFTLDNVTTHVIETEVGNFTISLYPNPNPGEVFIDCDQVMESLKVINTQGQTLLEETVNGASTSFIMYRNTFTANTIYFTVIKLQNGGTVTKKFIFSPK